MTVTRPDLKTITYKYDSAGRRSSIATSTDTINYAYSTTTGNFSTETVVNGEVLAHAYNGPLPIKSKWTGTVAGSVSRAYNNNFWVSSEAVTGGSSIAFTYDNDGLPTHVGSLSIFDSAQNELITGTTLGLAIDSRTYNSFGELTGYTAGYNGASVYTVQFTRDANGRISAKAGTIGGTTTNYGYSYDLAGRLHSVTQNGSTVTTYAYDNDSNRVDRVLTTQQFPRLSVSLSVTPGIKLT